MSCQLRDSALRTYQPLLSPILCVLLLHYLGHYVKVTVPGVLTALGI